ncbi:hypothetical protein C5167_031921 [Papaver somniferum]|uniref:Protein LURP-one-related 15 n=1 Tax=Papaver somniferum TaxID=3469 RepID=A0A4Y7K5L8_PAPSO|nr:protein LURP-one-related 10-like [Papaver somniferum]RZC68644.1 hypothetical protein C5167_031921 [Papaver somniferum]
MNQQQPNNSSIIVISPHFCNPYQVNLYIAKKVKNVTEGNKLGVFDTNGNNIFKVTGNLLSSCRMLVDAAGVPIVTLQEQRFTLHNRWKVYRGDSSNSENLLFSIKNSKALQIKTNLDVFLASNTNEDVCDFKVKQNYSEKSCVVYRGSGSENIIAEMHKEKTEVLGKDTFSVTIHPNIDYAFIIALRVVLDEMNKAAKRGDSGVGAVSGAVVGVITA